MINLFPILLITAITCHAQTGDHTVYKTRTYEYRAIAGNATSNAEAWDWFVGNIETCELHNELRNNMLLDNKKSFHQLFVITETTCGKRIMKTCAQTAHKSKPYCAAVKDAMEKAMY
ncbi:MAG: hypothetical protein FWB90_00780 [Fibromonadales bacterium]|nr:hypothetical protein [Fibromonadales bacterium]